MMRDSFRAYCQEKLMPRILMANRNEGNFVLTMWCSSYFEALSFYNPLELLAGLRLM